MVCIIHKTKINRHKLTATSLKIDRCPNSYLVYIPIHTLEGQIA